MAHIKAAFISDATHSYTVACFCSMTLSLQDCHLPFVLQWPSPVANAPCPMAGQRGEEKERVMHSSFVSQMGKQNSATRQHTQIQILQVLRDGEYLFEISY